MARKKSLDSGTDLSINILNESALLFYEKGYTATSIRDIADEVKISASTLYHHFKNKQEILDAVLSRFMQDFLAATLPVLQNQSLTAKQRLQKVIKIHIQISESRKPEMLTGNAIKSALSHAQRSETTRMQIEYQKAVESVIDEGQQNNEFSVPDTELTTIAILEMLNGVRDWFTPDSGRALDEVIENHSMLIMRILGTTTN